MKSINVFDWLNGVVLSLGCVWEAKWSQAVRNGNSINWIGMKLLRGEAGAAGITNKQIHSIALLFHSFICWFAFCCSIPFIELLLFSLPFAEHWLAHQPIIHKEREKQFNSFHSALAAPNHPNKFNKFHLFCLARCRNALHSFFLFFHQLILKELNGKEKKRNDWAAALVDCSIPSKTSFLFHCSIN